MIKELLGRVDEMYGATLLAGVAGYAMYMNINGGLVEICVMGIVALLGTKAKNMIQDKGGK